MNPDKPKHTIQMVMPKIEKYCAYQERCHQEVINKLKEYQLYKDEIDDVLSRLIKSNFVNEERFAIAFVRGKNKQKKWGKNKIIFELKKRKISDYCIKKATIFLEEDHYEDELMKLAEKYFQKLKDHLNVTKQRKTIQYLLGKGYEFDKIQEVVKNLKK